MTYYIVFDPTDPTLPYAVVRQDGHSTGWGTSINSVVNADPTTTFWEFEHTLTEQNIIDQMNPNYMLLAVIKSDEPPSLELIQSNYPELLL